MDDFGGYLLLFLGIFGFGFIGYNGIIKDHPIERYYISGQVYTECGTKIKIVSSKPWDFDKIVYKASTFEEALEKVKQLNDTLEEN